MHAFFKNILRILTLHVLRNHHPLVIGITGSVGKTTCKEAVYAVLHRKYFVRKSTGNSNTEIGIPLAVLGIEPSGSRDKPATIGSRIKLIFDIVVSIPMAFGISKKSYPRILILELGADRPGDIEYLTEIVRPKIAVVTAVGDMPVHVEYYDNPAAVAHEKAKILKYVNKDGLAVLNADDSVVMDMKRKIRGPITTVGFGKSADLWVSDVSFYLGVNDMVEGLSCKIHRGESFLPVRLPGFVAAHQLYSALAAVAIGLHLGMNLVDITNAFEHITLPPHRLSLVPGKQGTIIIDDTYNASPLSMQAGLAALKNLPGKRKVAILGEMAELGTYSEEEHRKIDELATASADQVIWCKHSSEIIEKVRSIPKPGDVILIKGSRVARMERVVNVLKL